MYEKQGMYFADWRDKKGVRHRKSFTTSEAALLYESAQKPKRLGKLLGRADTPSRPESRNIAYKTALITDGLHRLLRLSQGLCGQLNSTSEPSASSTEKSTKAKTTSRAKTAPTPSGGSSASSKTMVRQHSLRKSSRSPNRVRATSRPRKTSGGAS